MSFKKRAAAVLTALGIACSFTGCSDTSYGLTVDGTKVPAGVYIYYAMQAQSTAVNMLKEEYPDLDTTDVKAVKASVLEGVDTMTWIYNKATELCVNYVAIENKFDELNLTLDDDAKAYIDDYVEYMWSMSGEYYEANGVSEASFRKLVTSANKSEAIFLHYYDTEGELGASDEELKAYYVENYMRAEYIKIDKLDGSGNALTDTSELQKLCEEYEERVADAYDEGGAEAVMTEMSEVRDDYKAYCTSISKEAAGVTETTTEATTDASTTEAATEAATEEEGTTETAAESGETSEETTTTAAEESGAQTTTTTVAETGETSEETTTTTLPFPNETIIAMIDESDYEEGEEITYSPNEEVYKALLATEEADYAKPALVEDDKAFYLLVRYEIEDRVTEEDLWNESTIYNVQTAMFYEDFEELLKSWTDAMTVERNDAAYKRYDPFKQKS